MSRLEKITFISCALLFFAFSFNNYFVCDDFEFVGRIDWSNASWYLTHSWGYGNEYRPLLVYSYALDRSLGGTAPMFYHLTNTLLHIVNALLVSSIFARLSPLRTLPVLTAAFFALNPVSHESVLWVSGRPVVLSCLFVLFAVWCALRAPEAERPKYWWAAMYTGFLLGLLTYEGSIVMPLLALLTCWMVAARRRSPLPWLHLCVLFLIAGVYLIAWNLFFSFTITRFPVEHSWTNAFLSFGKALGHSFHGSSRVAIGGLYLLVVGVLVMKKEGRKLVAATFVWMAAAYLPFVVVHGYADRFAYLSSAAVACVLSTGVAMVMSKQRALGWACGFILLMVLAVGMAGRIQVWKTAGEIARRIPADIKRLHPSVPDGTPLILLNVPAMYRDAYVYLTGVERAVALQYPGSVLKIYRRDYAALPDSTIVIDCSGGVARDVGRVGVLRRF